MNDYELLRKSIEFATYELDQFKETKDLKNTTSGVVSSLFRKIIELSMGVLVSAANGLKGPADLNFRGLIEAYLAFRYIVQEKEEEGNRALAYKVGFHKLQIEDVEKLLNNPHLNIDTSKYEKGIKYHRESLEKEEFREILAEYEDTKIRNRIRYVPVWYSLYGGPKSINQLANHIEEMSNPDEDKQVFATLYSSLSTSAHNYVALSNIVYYKNGDVSLKEVYSDPNAENFNLVAVRSLLTGSIYHFTMNCYPEFIKEFKEYEVFIIDYLFKE